MDLISNSAFTLAALPAVSTLLATETVEYTSGAEVTGWALINTTGNVSVQSSDDDFSSTVYDSGVIAANGTYLLSIGALTAAKWRVLAGSGGATVGYLYTGTHYTTSAPAYPYSFESGRVAAQRKTLGGAVYSIDRHAKRRGNWQFNAIQTVEAGLWRTIYAETNGFRRGFIVNPDAEIALVTAGADQLDLRRNSPNAYTLLLKPEEVI